MNPDTKNRHKVVSLLEKGVNIPNPESLYLDDAVLVDHISGDGVTLYPGCRIYGANTVISKGSRLGYEGPVTLENCQLAPHVRLKGGYFKQAVFLEKASMGLGAHVREGTILEEQASGAHCVGLKQTLLFPFATLGSLINFCDCLLAGGTSRKHHSEVGSSYIHFNFSVDGDKTTPSLFGDVPRGVMLNQPPIFLGGQGGAVGPLRVGFGNGVSAGTILRKDVLKENRLIMGKSNRGGELPFTVNRYSGLSRMLEKNIHYLAGLVALRQWYRHVRKDFLRADLLGFRVYNGALDNLSLAVAERCGRLEAVAEKMPDSIDHDRSETTRDRKMDFFQHAGDICRLFETGAGDTSGIRRRDAFLEGLEKHKKAQKKDYISVIQSLPEDVSMAGTRWLASVIDDLCGSAAALVPGIKLFN